MSLTDYHLLVNHLYRLHRSSVLVTFIVNVVWCVVFGLLWNLLCLRKGLIIACVFRGIVGVHVYLGLCLELGLCLTHNGYGLFARGRAHRSLSYLHLWLRRAWLHKVVYLQIL